MDTRTSDHNAVYVCVATRSGDGWIVHCDDPEVWTTSPTLARAIDLQREAIAEVTGMPEDHLRVVLCPVLPRVTRETLVRAGELRETAAWANREAARQSRAAARELVAWGLSLRDIGWVLGVSHQRAHQLVTHKDERFS